MCKRVRMLCTVVIIVILISACNYSSSFSDNEDSNKTITVSFYEEPIAKEYHKYEIMDEGIVSFREMKKIGGSFGRGYDVTWYFDIIKPGFVRIKWSDPDYLQRWVNEKVWIDTYSIAEDYSYTYERYFLEERIFYIMCRTKEEGENTCFQGYFIDLNGQKRYYYVEDTTNIINSIKDLHLFLTERFTEYEPVKFIGNSGLKECNGYLNKIEENDFQQNIDCSKNDETLYAIHYRGNNIYYLKCSSKNTSVIDNENTDAIMEIFGDDWDKIEP